MPSKPSVCPQCSNETLWKNEGISKKNNKPYANLKCNSCGYIEWLSASKTLPQLQNSPVKAFPSQSGSLPSKPLESPNNASVMIADELRAMNEKLDDILELLRQNLGY